MKPKQLLWCITAATLLPAVAAMKEDGERPNVLIMMADDLGFGDLGCYGNQTIRTPNIDRLAKEGVKMTHSLAAASICTPSRAAFLTGRYPVRSGNAPSNYVRVAILTACGTGLPASEVTLAKVAKKAGYSTALLGKWHLGWSEHKSDPNHMHPLNQGFDYFYGIPLTNMKDFDPREEKAWRRGAQLNILSALLVTCAVAAACTCWLVRSGTLGCAGSTLAVLLVVFIVGNVGVIFWAMESLSLLNSFFYRNYDMVEQPIDLPTVTRKLVLEADQFLEERHGDGRPFFLFLSWLHVHTALATAPRFRGVSQHGPYGDVVEEMDWGVGRVLDSLDRLGMANNTLVYFTSDNGGHVEETDYLGRRAGGHNGVLRGGKSHGAPDGGIRVPTLLRWPGKVKAGLVTDEPVSLMDVMPTVARALHVQLPPGHEPDGRDLLPLLSGQETVSPHEFFFHYCQQEVHAVRYRPRHGTSVWKLVLYEPPYLPGTDHCEFICHCIRSVALPTPKLYDMSKDPGEQNPLSPADVKDYSEIVSRMLEALAKHRKSIVPVQNMYAIHRVLWKFWEQPVCNFPKFRCEDEKFKDVFDDDRDR